MITTHTFKQWLIWSVFKYTNIQWGQIKVNVPTNQLTSDAKETDVPLVLT